LLTWQYDRYGNRWNQTASTAPGYNPPSGDVSAVQPQLTFTGNNNRIDGWLYDAAGNLLYDYIHHYTYDAENRVATIDSAAAYIYDAEGTRVAKYGSGGALTASYVLGLGGEQVSEVNGAGAWMHSNVFVGGRLMATYEGPGGTASAGYHFHLTDWLGTQRVQTTANGNVSDLCYSYPFGDGLSCTGTDATEHHFTGKERDTESGLDYFGGRYLSSGLGRWMTTDKDFTLKRILPNPQKWNRYAYVLNNPLVLFDPDGLAEWYVFRPLIPARSKMSPQWQKAINTATARGDNVHMMLGKDATVKAFEQALKTPGAYVEAITHASPGGITLSDGSSQGSYGSTSSSMSQSSNPAEGITANVTGTSEVQVTAQEVAIVGCQSSSLDYQYSDTTFVGVDPGAGGGITTDLGSAIGASFLQAGGDQAGVDAGNSDIDSSQDSRNDGANVEMTPPSTPPSQPTSPPAQP
jgi:RHS repeat-associated protein